MKAELKRNQPRRQKRSATRTVPKGINAPGPVFTDLPGASLHHHSVITGAPLLQPPSSVTTGAPLLQTPSSITTGAPLLQTPSFPHTAVPVAAPQISPTKVEEPQKRNSRYPNSRVNRSGNITHQPQPTPAQYLHSSASDPSVNHPLRAVLTASQGVDVMQQYQLFGFPPVQSSGMPYSTQYQQYPGHYSHNVPSTSGGHYYPPDQRQYVQNIPRSYPSTPVSPPFSSPLQSPVHPVLQSAYYSNTAQYYSPGTSFSSVQTPPTTSPPGAYRSVPPKDPKIN